MPAGEAQPLALLLPLVIRFVLRHSQASQPEVHMPAFPSSCRSAHPARRKRRSIIEHTPMNGAKPALLPIGLPWFSFDVIVGYGSADCSSTIYPIPLWRP
jgi:hypothetical protein